MGYSQQEVLQYVEEGGIKFIRLAFCDVFGRQKNITIMPQELKRAFEYGIAIDGSAISGFGDETHSDLLLHPEADTLMELPWRPEHGKIVRMFANITYPDGRPFECDTRRLLKKAVKTAEEKGYRFYFGAEREFYIFRLDENANPTRILHDSAGYMDRAPEDKGENIRREICLTLEMMGIQPESSHHEEGPGQNEIDFRYSDPITAADNFMTFQTIVKTVADRNGLYADFSPKPLEDRRGNGLHINISVKSDDGKDRMNYMMAGILARIKEMTLFLNTEENSYRRLGKSKAPGYISWSSENRSQLIRIPAASGEYRRAELRSADPAANPYLAFALVIYASLDGIENSLQLPPAANFNFFSAAKSLLENYERLPSSLQEARKLALESNFIKEYIPQPILDIYCEE